ncbi:hemagglutinin repeat-containing protein [Tatumella morbirosei]|uniref:two-partner secretion domain-containing protein n=1 Tax=Tatumella morbirosei TaxID=642227 RepID=UPI00062A267D|nr:hemagglutinin repeat-containing protein [Tatumella morbirosei]
MNKQRYRIIFSQPRQSLMVVADIAGLAGRSPSSSFGRALRDSSRLCLLSRLRFAILLTLNCVSFTPQAAIIADRTAPAGQQPTVISTASGVEQVNIRTPGAGGVSRNVFSRFDVDSKGVVLNNSHADTRTSIAGMVTANPWLAGGEAKIILNEVNARDPSQLNGFIEVAGKQAQVVIANPAGITCSGCGFINANRATLTTGQVQISEGNLTGYRVSQGEIAIGPGGMDTSRQDHTDLISRTVKINAALWAKDLRITAGRNQVDAGNRQVSSLQGDSGTRPALAIDVALLGGMYANKIKLLGTEKGVGVHNAGNIGVSAGNVELTADGKIVNRGNIDSSGNLALSSATGISNSGAVYAAGNVGLSADGKISNQGTIYSDSQLSLSSASDISNSGSMYANGNAQLSSQRMLDNSGTLKAKGDLQVRSTTFAARQGSAIAAGAGADGQVNRTGNLSILASDQLQSEGRLLAGGELALRGQQIVLNGSETSADRVVIDSGEQGLRLSNQTLVQAHRQLVVTSRGALLNDRSQLNTAGSAEVSVSGLLDNRGKITAAEGLKVNSAELMNDIAGEITGNHTRITTVSTLTNQGLIDGGDSWVQSGHLINQGSGRIYADRLSVATVTLDNLARNNTAATLAGRQQLDIGAQQINNDNHSLIYSGGDLRIGGWLNTHGQAEGAAVSLVNHAATLEAMGNLSLAADSIVNRNAGLETQLTVTENARYHEAVLKGEITRYHWDDIDTSYKNKYNVQDAIMPDGSRNNDFYEYDYQRVVTETEVTFSDPGKILAGGNLLLSGGQLDNYDSQIIAGGSLNAAAGLAMNNIATTGVRITRDSGSLTHWYAKKKKRKNGSVKTSQGKKRTSYHPEAVTETIDPGVSRIVGNQSVAGSAGIPGDRSVAEVLEIARLPESSLFRVQPDALNGYLVETDPRFTQRQQWIGSDYMLSALKQDHNQVLKRLGDGYYEQQLLREQITQQTGQRYLNGYHNDNDQFKALMNAGITFAGQYSLVPGVALTAEQMALLTSDMVWMVKREVTLADGSRQTVLTPQLYLQTTRGHPLTSAVISGKQLVMDTGQALINSGNLLAQQDLSIKAASVVNLGRMTAQQLTLTSQGDVINQGGVLEAGKALQIAAGGNLISRSTLASTEDQQMIDRQAGIYLQDAEGTLRLSAADTLRLTASQLNSAGNVVLQAGQDLLLDVLTITGSEYSDFGGSNTRSLSWQQDKATAVSSGGDMTLSAGRNLTAQAAEVIAGGHLSAAAGQDLQLLAGNTRWHLTEHSKQSSGSAISKETRESHDEIQVSQATGSQFSGHSVELRSGQSLKVQGSRVAGDNNVSLSAGTSLILSGAAESREETHWSKLKSSGLSGTGGVGVSIGSQSLKITDSGASEGSKASMLGSIDGDLNLRAGDTLTVSGADLLAGNDLSLSARQVDILAEETRSQQKRTVEQKQSGFTLAISGAAGSLVNSAISGIKQATEQSSGRVAVLENMKTALSATQAVQSVRLAEASGGGVTSVIGLNLSYGSQSSTSEQTSQQVVSEGSSLAAANHLTIQATGGDINIQGSRLQAGNTLDLQAQRDVNLISAENSWQQQGRNESHGSSVGAAVTGGGFTINASVNRGKGHENGQGVSHSETVINAGHALNISSGRDITLQGAQASADAVTVRAGSHLTLSSEQDSDDYDMQQKNISAGASAGSGSASASYTASKDSMRSRYQSVQEQTGIFAGQGGFTIDTGGHTQLNGAVISSTASAEKNSLNTGTLGFSDIQNQAEYRVSHQASGAAGGVGINPGQLVAGQLVTSMASQLLSGMNDSDSDSSVTGSAVSAGTLSIRDTQQQSQDPDTLSRDVANAHQALSVIFNKEQQQERLKAAQLISEIGMQISDIVLIQGAIMASKDASQQSAAATPEQREQAKARWEQKNPGSTASEQDISGQLYNDFYNQSLNQSGMGTGGGIQKVIQAAAAAVQGLAGGDIGQAVAGGAAPYIAGVIGNSGLDITGKTLAHAAVNAAFSAVQGNNALAGAVGAAAGEITGIIATDAYGKPVSELSEGEKQTVSALATLAAGLAGGVTGDSSSAALSAAQAGKTTVENNFLGNTSSAKLDKAVEKIKQGDKSLAAANELIKLENADKRSDALVDKFTKNPSQMSTTERAELAGYLRVYAAEMEKEYGSAVSQELVKGLLSGQDYMKRSPDSEAMAKAQTIMNTWGYHKSNASIGDAPLMFSTNVLGTTIKEGMALNAAIGVGVNSGVQLTGKDPFSYVDMIMAGITSAATTGKGIGASAAINMGGAAIGSGIKGEDPVNSIIGAGFGSLGGSGTSSVISGVLGSSVKAGASEAISSIGGSLAGEAVGNTVKGVLDEAEKSNKK